MLCCNKRGQPKNVWCKFQDVFSTTWPHGLISKGWCGGGAVWGLSLPSQVTAQVQHVERKQKLSWLSHCLQLALSLSCSLFSLSYSISVALLHSLCLLDLTVSTHSWVWTERGGEKADATTVAATTMGHEWTIVILACLWCAHHTHRDTHRHTNAQVSNILDTVFKFN